MGLSKIRKNFQSKWNIKFEWLSGIIKKSTCKLKIYRIKFNFINRKLSKKEWLIININKRQRKYLSIITLG